MEILLRATPGNNYAWVKASYINNMYTVGGNDDDWEYEVEEINILSVRNDERIGKVRCLYCQALIENTPESIERHYAEEEAKRDCLKCSHMSITRRHNTERSYELGENGKYNVTETYVASLLCSNGWNSYDVNDDRTKQSCDYHQHRRYGVAGFDDIFMKYPDPFVKQITVDVLNANKYPFEKCVHGYFVYDLKVRGTLKAVVNELGIVDHFITNIRGKDYVLYYSDKYHKLFKNYRGTYEDAQGMLSEAKTTGILNRLEKLYKEADNNDEK